MNSLTSKLLVIASLLALPSTAARAADEDKTAPKAAPTASAIDRVVSHMWWNQTPKVAAIGLTADQRAQLDALGRAYLEARRDRTGQRDALAAFSAALKQNDFEAARKHAQALADASAEPHLAQAEMMIDALKLLSAEQRGKIAANFPGLLEGPWMRTGANLRQRRGAPVRPGQ